jgi:hypothetical protein
MAYVYDRTSVSATVFNGLFVRAEDGAFRAFPAAGGELVRAGGFQSTNSKDVQLFLNQIVKERRVRRLALLLPRHDWFDPSDIRGSNDRWRLTAFANTPLNDGVQFIAEYQHVAQRRTDAVDLTDGNVQVCLIWIW